MLLVNFIVQTRSVQPRYHERKRERKKKFLLASFNKQRKNASGRPCQNEKG